MYSEKIFNELAENLYFTRITPSNPFDLYLGLDEIGRLAIEFRGNFDPKEVIGTAAIEVKQYHHESYNAIRFSLIDNTIKELFYTFCDDLIEYTALSDIEDGYFYIINRFYQWKKMFIISREHILSEKEIQGLIGEILFLKDHLSKQIGLENALLSWVGPEKAHKDFSYDHKWVEIKTINKNIQSIHISSVEQLEDENCEGNLFVFVLEKMSENYDGISLNSLIFNTLNLFKNSSDSDLFCQKLTKAKYEYNEIYNKYIYKLDHWNNYIISKDFPRLTKHNLPKEIIEASYDIDLNLIDNFKIGSKK